MTYRELAQRILGVDEGASPAQIKRAARRLMLEHHPDQGGAALRLRCVLAARETLLRAA